MNFCVFVSFSLDHNDSRFPHEITFAKCLCGGCIIRQLEDYTYNSVLLYSKLMVLKKTRCQHDPNKYVVIKQFIDIPVACTCVLPKSTEWPPALFSPYSHISVGFHVLQFKLCSIKFIYKKIECVCNHVVMKSFLSQFQMSAVIFRAIESQRAVKPQTFENYPIKTIPSSVFLDRCDGKFGYSWFLNSFFCFFMVNKASLH